ncbi:hypothetical protein [Sphingorhabdus sp.]
MDMKSTMKADRTHFCGAQSKLVLVMQKAIEKQIGTEFTDQHF